MHKVDIIFLKGEHIVHSSGFMPFFLFGYIISFFKKISETDTSHVLFDITYLQRRISYLCLVCVNNLKFKKNFLDVYLIHLEFVNLTTNYCVIDNISYNF